MCTLRIRNTLDFLEEWQFSEFFNTDSFGLVDLQTSTDEFSQFGTYAGFDFKSVKGNRQIVP